MGNVEAQVIIVFIALKCTVSELGHGTDRQMDRRTDYSIIYSRPTVGGVLLTGRARHQYIISCQCSAAAARQQTHPPKLHHYHAEHVSHAAGLLVKVTCSDI